MAGVNFDFIIAITLLNSESSVLIFGRSAQVGLVIAPLPRHCDDCHVAALLAMTEAIHCGLGAGTWIATALRASQ
jgi:hypothetical protein